MDVEATAVTSRGAGAAARTQRNNVAANMNVFEQGGGNGGVFRGFRGNVERGNRRVGVHLFQLNGA